MTTSPSATNGLFDPADVNCTLPKGAGRVAAGSNYGQCEVYPPSLGVFALVLMRYVFFQSNTYSTHKARNMLVYYSKLDCSPVVFLMPIKTLFSSSRQTSSSNFTLRFL